MGGDRECPKDCPLAVWAGLSPTDRKAQRKPIAENLYKQGFTMEQIATQLGVAQSTITEDLRNLSTVDKLKPAKSTNNPKGAGRPKGRTKSPPRPRVTDPHEQTILALHDQGVPSPKIAVEVGLNERVVHRFVQDEEIRRDAAAQIDPATLSLTAQEKLDAAIRAGKRKLDLEFEARVLAECKHRLDTISLPHYAKQLAELERTISNRKGIMDRITYRKILSCLHPDRVTDELLKKRYEEAFRLFTELEKVVLDEKQSPTEFRKMPRTYEELMAMKAKVQAERRAKRAASKFPASRH
jgi:hypothetical protein